MCGTDYTERESFIIGRGGIGKKELFVQKKDRGISQEHQFIRIPTPNSSHQTQIQPKPTSNKHTNC